MYKLMLSHGNVCKNCNNGPSKESLRNSSERLFSTNVVGYIWAYISGSKK